jgi:nicotinamidase-related amidase
MKIAQPTAGTRRALLIIDVQPATITDAAARSVVHDIALYIAASTYDAYVIATFSAPEDSMFARQLNWMLSAEAAGPTEPTIVHAVQATRRPVMEMAKTLRSVLKGTGADDVQAFLDRQAIDEVHLVGFDINDCVLATAYDALDRGYFTFVIEECAGRTDSDRSTIEAALTALRKQRMTNTSASFPANLVEIGTADV